MYREVLGVAVCGCGNTYTVSVWIGWARDQTLSSGDPDLLRDLVHEGGRWVCRVYLEGFLVPGLCVKLLEMTCRGCGRSRWSLTRCSVGLGRWSIAVAGVVLITSAVDSWKVL